MSWARQALKPLERSSTASVNVESFIQILLNMDPSTAYIVCDDTLGGLTAIDPRKFADEFLRRRKMDANDPGWSIVGSVAPTVPGVPAAAPGGTGFVTGGALRDLESTNSFTVVGGAKGGKKKKK
ncbi:hypothetical protein BC829DRAFT_383933 [Chytridium lagenaria]|nr:hypothetical protein BC829DRAFT_383933 [Chytridium lagenaria]